MERKHGLSTKQLPASAYAGSSKNLKDLKDLNKIKQPRMLQPPKEIVEKANSSDETMGWADNIKPLGATGAKKGARGAGGGGRGALSPLRGKLW